MEGAWAIPVHLSKKLTEVVVPWLGRRQGELAKQRASAIAQDSGLWLGERDPKWLSPECESQHKSSNIILSFTLVGATCPVQVVDQGKRRPAYECKRTKDKAYYTNALGQTILIRRPRVPPWKPYPDMDAGGCWNCGVPGHWKRICTRDPARPVCEICNWLGHWKERCPNQKGIRQRARMLPKTPVGTQRIQGTQGTQGTQGAQGPTQQA